MDSSDRFQLDAPARSTVEVFLTWADHGATDRPLRDRRERRRELEPEGARVRRQRGGARRDPGGALLRHRPTGVEYTLTAVVQADADGDGAVGSSDECPDAFGSPPTGCPDTDRDGGLDRADVCADEPGDGADGCPVGATEHVHVYVDGVLAASQDVLRAVVRSSIAPSPSVSSPTITAGRRRENAAFVLPIDAQLVGAGRDLHGDVESVETIGRVDEEREQGTDERAIPRAIRARGSSASPRT